MSKKVNVIVADDHQIVIDGIKSLLESDNNIVVVDTASNGKELIDKVSHAITPIDLIITDIQMPVINGIDATSTISRKFPAIKIIALTMHNEKALINSIMDAGAHGYILKNIGKDELLMAINLVMEGKKYFSGEVTLTVMNTDEDGDNYNLNVPLTQREVEIVKLIVQGMTNIEIGDKLFISHRTVDTHRTNIMKKVNAKNVAALIKYAIQKNIV